LPVAAKVTGKAAFGRHGDAPPDPKRQREQDIPGKAPVETGGYLVALGSVDIHPYYQWGIALLPCITSYAIVKATEGVAQMTSGENR